MTELFQSNAIKSTLSIGYRLNDCLHRNTRSHVCIEYCALPKGSRQFWVAEAVKAFGGRRNTLEMLDAFRYETMRYETMHYEAMHYEVIRYRIESRESK